jgi:hypothetical protein
MNKSMTLGLTAKSTKWIAIYDPELKLRVKFLSEFFAPIFRSGVKKKN